MNKRIPSSRTIAALTFVLVGILLLGSGAFLSSVQHVAAQDHMEEGNAVRGGQLYDEWWAVPEPMEEGHAAEEAGHAAGEEHTHGGAGPTEDHPLWATQTTNTLTGSDTWRCNECHGWDYKGVDGAYGSGSHFTGFPGVMESAGKPVDEIVAALQGATNPDHDFSAVMDENDLLDLATFISKSLIDPSTMLTSDNTPAGDAVQGKALFENVCILCHGPEGNAINFHGLAEPEFVGAVASDDTLEFIHKVRFGQPGWPMPSAIVNGWSDQDVANLLAYAVTLTTEPALSGGGQLYDAWWDVLGVDAPETDQPLWSTQTTNTRGGADSWRCKECHGWDYRGADGAYGSGSHATGFVGVFSGTAPAAEEVVAWLDGSNNADHDFSAVMDEVAINALAKFLSEEVVDVTVYVNDDKTVNGDPRLGRDLFADTCAACHGTDGRMMNFNTAEEPEYVGTVAADNPWEFFHKASFGHPGVPMPAGRALGWELQDIADVLAYAQTLPAD